MNGFTLWVLLAASGQVGDGIERDKGWQINPEDGLLEYVVQLSPEKANYMSSAAKEFQSDVPAYVAARLSRVVVRIGTEPIISTPVDEVMRLPVISTAVLANIEEAAGRGRYAQLEADPSAGVVNVNSTTTPPASLTDSPRTLPPDNRLAQNSPSAGFANDARGLGTVPNKYANTGSPPSAAQSGSGAQLPPAQTGILGPSLPTSAFPTSPTNSYPGSLSNSGPGNSGIGSSSGIGSGGIGTSQNGSGTGGYAGNNAFPGSTATQPYANQPQNNPNSYGQSTGQSWNQAPSYSNSSTNSGNFGSLPGGTPSQPFPPNQYATMGTGVGASNPYNQPPYAQPGNYSGSGSTLTTDPRSIPSYSPPNYFPQTPLIADSRASAGLPTTSPGGSSSTTNNRDMDRELASSTRRNLDVLDDPRDISQAGVPRGMDNVVPVMFVLSLVVNFYLGMLIRKLLTRYRSLLSSVRGQAV